MATTSNATVTVRANEHDTLDALCHRHLGRTAGTVEATLAATPGLARRAADLGAGEPVTLVAAPVQPRNLIQLWD
ncbi:MAG: tail protein X [Proteobacteria bacterium]|nr:tail protein X [Pseudomonadota bacterium]